jgi:hypothetical protein
VPPLPVASPPEALTDSWACAKPAHSNTVARSKMGLDLFFVIFCLFYLLIFVLYVVSVLPILTNVFILD